MKYKDPETEDKASSKKTSWLGRLLGKIIVYENGSKKTLEKEAKELLRTDVNLLNRHILFQRVFGQRFWLK